MANAPLGYVMIPRDAVLDQNLTEADCKVLFALYHKARYNQRIDSAGAFRLAKGSLAWLAKAADVVETGTGHSRRAVKDAGKKTVRRAIQKLLKRHHLLQATRNDRGVWEFRLPAIQKKGQSWVYSFDFFWEWQGWQFWQKHAFLVILANYRPGGTDARPHHAVIIRGDRRPGIMDLCHVRRHAGGGRAGNTPRATRMVQRFLDDLVEDEVFRIVQRASQSEPMIVAVNKPALFAVARILAAETAAEAPEKSPRGPQNRDKPAQPAGTNRPSRQGQTGRRIEKTSSFHPLGSCAASQPKDDFVIPPPAGGPAKPEKGSLAVGSQDSGSPCPSSATSLAAPPEAIAGRSRSEPLRVPKERREGPRGDSNAVPPQVRALWEASKSLPGFQPCRSGQDLAIIGAFIEDLDRRFIPNDLLEAWKRKEFRGFRTFCWQYVLSDLKGLRGRLVKKMNDITTKRLWNEEDYLLEQEFLRNQRLTILPRESGRFEGVLYRAQAKFLRFLLEVRPDLEGDKLRGGGVEFQHGRLTDEQKDFIRARWQAGSIGRREGGRHEAAIEV